MSRIDSVLRAGVVLFLSLPALANDWWVSAGAPPGGYGAQYAPFQTIQRAVQRSRDGDTIWVRPGTYFENVVCEFRSVRIVSTDGPTYTFVDGDRNGSVFYLRGGSPIVEGFTIEHGSGNSLPGAWETAGGGVLFHDTVDARVARCVIRNNYARSGDGVAAIQGRGTVLDTLIEHNGGSSYPGYCQSGDNGGGAWGDGNLWLYGCTLRQNVASIEGGGAYGANLDLCVVEQNRAAEGAGVASCFVTNSQIRSNFGYSCDSGMTWAGGALSSTLENCDVISNSAYDAGGGAVYSTLRNCRVLNNGVYYPDPWNNLGYGGGTYACELVDCRVESNVILHDPNAYWPYPGCGGGVAGGSALRCVIRDNWAWNAAGVWQTDLDRCVVYANQGGGVTGSTVVNSILWGNPGVQAVNCDVRWSDVQGGTAGVGNIALDPLFWSAASGDFRLQPGSPCIDAGRPGDVDPDGTRVDMGAFPFGSSVLGAVTFCDNPPSSEGCVPQVSLASAQPASATQPIVIATSGLPGERAALVMLGFHGACAVPFGSGTSCLAPPRLRTTAVSTSPGETACAGEFTFELSTWCAARSIALAASDIVAVQVWYRDPGAPLGAALSHALRFQLAP